MKVGGGGILPQLEGSVVCLSPPSLPLAVSGSRAERAKAALVEMGSCVITGITFTKFVGVVVLAWAPSTLFRLYYFRMYATRARMLLLAPTILRTRRTCRLFACSK